MLFQSRIGGRSLEVWSVSQKRRRLSGRRSKVGEPLRLRASSSEIRASPVAEGVADGSRPWLRHRWTTAEQSECRSLWSSGTDPSTSLPHTTTITTQLSIISDNTQTLRSSVKDVCKNTVKIHPPPCPHWATPSHPLRAYVLHGWLLVHFNRPEPHRGLNVIIITRTIFIVLSSWSGHCESSLGSSGECRAAPSGRRPSDQATWLGLWVRLF